jgi:RNA polymerase sigma factor (sigma-70 family)
VREANEEDLRLAQDVARGVAARHLRGRAWEGVDGEDVVQDVLLRFARLDLDAIANVPAWVAVAARNRCLDVAAASRRHDQRQLDAGLDAVRAVVGPSARAMAPMMLAFALEGLSTQEQAILRAHGQGWSNAEIAKAFGYAGAPSAAVAISRAKAKVRQRFSGAAQRRELVAPQRVY